MTTLTACDDDSTVAAYFLPGCSGTVIVAFVPGGMLGT